MRFSSVADCTKKDSSIPVCFLPARWIPYFFYYDSKSTQPDAQKGRATNYKQCFGSGFIDSGFGSRVSMTKNKKNLQLEKIDIFSIKNCNYLSLGLHKGCPSYRRSPQKRTSSTSKHKILYFTCFYFCG